jgi:hypothetical protein
MAFARIWFLMLALNPYHRSIWWNHLRSTTIRSPKISCNLLSKWSSIFSYNKTKNNWTMNCENHVNFKFNPWILTYVINSTTKASKIIYQIIVTSYICF